MLDYKITKKHYPRTNSNSVLEFIFEKDPNLFLKKNKILIRENKKTKAKLTVFTVIFLVINYSDKCHVGL